MGFPISRFHMLAGFCSGDSHARRVISSFKIYCIIVHDPDDEAFKKKIKERFLSLHQETGKDLLFITFVDPPNRFRGIEAGESPEEREERTLRIEVGFDDRLILSNFLRSVAPLADLPAIIITSDLMSREYILLQTSTATVERQLRAIASFSAESEPHISIRDERFRDMLSDIGRWGYEELSARSIAEELVDTLAIQDVRKNDRDAMKWVRKRLAEKKSEMDSHPSNNSLAIAYYNYESGFERARQSSDSLTPAPKPKLKLKPYHSDDERYFLRETDDVYNLSSKLDAQVTRPSFFQQFSIKQYDIAGYDLCHPLSKNDIEQYNDILLYFIQKDEPNEEDLYYRDPEARKMRNFMPLAIFFGSFMEREVNLSLVQLMRSRFGIEMPEYFNRFKPGCQAVVESGKSQKGRSVSIPLNACRYPDRLVPVMLGQSYYAFCAMSNPGASPGVDNPFPPEFFQCWKTLVDNRNVAGHAQYEDTDLFDYRKFKAFHSAFSSILFKYLRQMEEIKTSLLGGIHL